MLKAVPACSRYILSNDPGLLSVFCHDLLNQLAVVDAERWLKFVGKLGLPGHTFWLENFGEKDLVELAQQ